MKPSICVTAILLGLYSLFLAYGPRPSTLSMQSQWQDNNQIVEAYFRKEMHAPVVFVGSSLSRRLRFDDPACAYNMALGGDSSLTGLAAILRSSHLPKKVFIEINVPDRPANTGLVETADSFYKKLAPIFYTENMPVNLLYSFLAAPHKKDLNQQISEPLRLEGVALQLKDYGNLIPEDDLRAEIAFFSTAINALEKRGIEVVLYELPISRELRETPKERQIKTAFSEQFPRNKLITARDMGIDVASTDGLHMSENEAREVSTWLRQSYASACP
ncbi:hypothetical protein PMI16_02829 [Herbaspirillum sp. CF444]|uniref:hypothetical protein n=1 Tax=Herbaspirillum sp. CF444 TaxID=1144319 RepID=UPI0002727951|nr:hypothetical protein [Herbaspirillum sp. CF444]EJL87942.1 hypothetical protein PMI16_02829 [Herbaspirillum sp. CF444]